MAGLLPRTSCPDPGTATWEAGPGEHRLRARADDETGRVQPVEAPWNRGGFADNADAAVPVLITSG